MTTTPLPLFDPAPDHGGRSAYPRELVPGWRVWWGYGWRVVEGVAALDHEAAVRVTLEGVGVVRMPRREKVEIRR